MICTSRRRARTTGGVLCALIACSALVAASLAANPSVDLSAFSHELPGTPLPAGWKPLTFKHIARHTEYTLVRDPQAGVVMRAHAQQSASGLIHDVDVDADARPLLRWRSDADHTGEVATAFYGDIMLSPRP